MKPTIRVTASQTSSGSSPGGYGRIEVSLVDGHGPDFVLQDEPPDEGAIEEAGDEELAARAIGGVPSDGVDGERAAWGRLVGEPSEVRQVLLTGSREPQAHSRSVDVGRSVGVALLAEVVALGKPGDGGLVGDPGPEHLGLSAVIDADSAVGHQGLPEQLLTPLVLPLVEPFSESIEAATHDHVHWPYLRAQLSFEHHESAERLVGQSAPAVRSRFPPPPARPLPLTLTQVLCRHQGESPLCPT